LNTLAELQAGKLVGEIKVKIAEGLKTFPEELYTLADSLEILDLTDNNLSTLPDDLNKLHKLRILFISNNQFKEVPSVLATCPNLTMIGFRNNQIDTFEENAVPLHTRWLILTDNNLKTLPNSMGDLKYLQKCMLSGNKLTTLPKSMVNCHNLELLRIAVNQLAELPSWLLTLPKLSWLAYSGNPFCAKHPNCDTPLKEIAWKELEIKEVLGEGASGLISKATFQGEDVAIKVFKGEITSDGLPQEEMDINISMGRHPHLIDVMARVTGHPQGRDVLMLELIPASYANLGLPPTLTTCSRDVYTDGFTLTLVQVLKILQGMANAATHMHARGIMHGDFYAHNIMIDAEANSILGDFGGASFFEPREVEVRQGLERLEVRAFGCLVEELLELCIDDSSNDILREKLMALRDRCLDNDNEDRPLFDEVFRVLSTL
jgi:hypothetical protein